MKTITWDQACDFLKNCDACWLDDSLSTLANNQDPEGNKYVCFVSLFHDDVLYALSHKNVTVNVTDYGSLELVVSPSGEDIEDYVVEIEPLQDKRYTA